MFSIILAAGKGTRMGALDRPKVCADLEGEPVICRAIDSYTRCGIEHHILVVGQGAEPIAATVCERFPATIFAFQSEPRGTGHAARVGLSVLDAFDYAGDVMVVAGDKVLDECAVRGLIDHFRSTQADLCLMVGAREDFPTSGRIVEDDEGNVLGIVEVSDIARARLIGRWVEAAATQPLSAEHVRAEILAAFPTERKARRALPVLWDLLDRAASITADDLCACVRSQEAFFQFTGRNGAMCRFSAEQLEQRARYANLSVYVFPADVLRYALKRLVAANAQGEEYLTDAVGIVAAARTPRGDARFRVVPYCIEHPDHAMAFNTPEELAVIRKHYAAARPIA